MKFIGRKRVVKVDADYSQVKKLGEFWDEMRNLFPNDFLYGLGTNWTQNTVDYYIGKIDEEWPGGSDVTILPDDGWIEYSCKVDAKEIEELYRGIYKQGSLDYEVESMKDGIFTTKVHFLNNGGNTNEV